jgi:hypothetical protein
MAKGHNRKMKFPSIKSVQGHGFVTAAAFFINVSISGLLVWGNSRINEQAVTSSDLSSWSEGDDFRDSRLELQGMNDKVLAPAKDCSYLFPEAGLRGEGGNAVNHVARWNGMRWESMGGGV